MKSLTLLVAASAAALFATNTFAADTTLGPLAEQACTAEQLEAAKAGLDSSDDPLVNIYAGNWQANEFTDETGWQPTRFGLGGELVVYNVEGGKADILYITDAMYQGTKIASPPNGICGTLKAEVQGTDIVYVNKERGIEIRFMQTDAGFLGLRAQAVGKGQYAYVLAMLERIGDMTTGATD